MYSKKALVAVALIVLLAAPVALADSLSPVASLWEQLVGLWNRAGSAMDPNGLDAGVIIDPNGLRAANSTGDGGGFIDPLGRNGGRPDDGGFIDPNGRNNGGRDEGGYLDPNGLTASGDGAGFDPHGAAGANAGGGGTDKGMGLDPNGG